MRIQLLSFPGCPNVEQARLALRRALAACNLPLEIEEVDTSASDTPETLRGWGSPTILIDGVDVAGEVRGAGASCRLYAAGEAGRGVPSDAVIQAAIRGRSPRRRGWFHSLIALPGLVLPLLPSAACPACLTAYAGFLSAIGLGVLLTERVLAPLIVVGLAVNLVSLAWSSRSHRRSGPLFITLAGSAAIVAGRLIWNVPGVLYVGVALLVAASLWTLWLKRPQPTRLVQLGGLRKEETRI